MYNHRPVEKKWQKIWEKRKLWRAVNPPAGGKPKYYALIEFPYPSGDGLHVGHIRSYVALDVIARKRRMEGWNVLYPIGWDAFGLPTENYAIKSGIPPEVATDRNTKTFRRQLKSLGFSFDWQREINTTDPNYYKWTQWIFLQFFKHGLAYKDSSYINWCLACRIGLANEEVTGGRCERCGGLVEKRLRKQWLLRITAYADKLLAGLDKVNFLEKIKTQQRNWIGWSEGRLIQFPASSLQLPVFTTRPDTIDGVTYLVLAPEHPFVSKLLDDKKIKNKQEVKKYIQWAMARTDIQRQESKEKTGVELRGFKAINPYNQEKVPVWVSDYVVMSYGTGAIMAVPAYDERDLEFAKKFRLPVKSRPLVPEKKWPGKKQVNYKLRDWVFSRQRYWGEPIPIIICESCGYLPVPEKDLPVKLPKVKNYQPRSDGRSPLASVASWVKVKCPGCAGPAQRETDTMPNWAGSSWYFLAYAVKESKSYQLQAKKLLKYWLPVDWYNGGMEHTTLHLLYSRFWNLFLHDIGIVPCAEPYQKRTAHGLVLGEGRIKMSKSRGNVINPDELVEEFGADSLRLYELFLGPFSEAVAWDRRGIVGMNRFLSRICGLLSKQQSKKAGELRDHQLAKLVHQTIRKVSDDIEAMHFNTAVSALMILLSELEKKSAASLVPHSYFLIFIKLLFPFAPHLAQELWRGLGEKSLLDEQPWPAWDKRLIKEDTFTLVIQVNGKTRGRLKVKIGIAQKEAEKAAKEHPAAAGHLRGKEVKQVIFVPNRLINLVVV